MKAISGAGWLLSHRRGRLEHEHRVNNIPAHIRYHFKKNIVALILVFNQWILLAITRQPNRFAQGIHRLQMFSPKSINLVQYEKSFRIPAGQVVVHSDQMNAAAGEVIR